MVELGIAIVSACLPTLRPLFSHGINGLQRLRSNSIGVNSGRKPSAPGIAGKEGWTPPSPDSIALDAESERKLRELSEKA